MDSTHPQRETRRRLALLLNVDRHLQETFEAPEATRRKLAARWLVGEISQNGKPAPFKAGKRWVVERPNS